MKSQISPFFTILGPDFVARKVPLYRRFWEHACGPSDPGVGGGGGGGRATTRYFFTKYAILDPEVLRLTNHIMFDTSSQVNNKEFSYQCLGLPRLVPGERGGGGGGA